MGFRGVDADNPGVEIIHRGKFKPLTDQQRRWLKRPQAIEPAIGHAKSDNRMDRCRLQGAAGDVLHALSCAPGNNIRWLMRATVHLAAKRSLVAPFDPARYARIGVIGSANAAGGLPAIVAAALDRRASLDALSARSTRQLSWVAD